MAGSITTKITDKQAVATESPAVEKVETVISTISTKRHVLTEEEAYGVLGYSFSTKKKWLILTAVFLVQISMNFNAAIYANAVEKMVVRFGITPFVARVGQMAFLVAYGFGCELWAPLSEEMGRWWPMFLSLLFVNLFQIPSALAPNFTAVLIARILGGLSSAGGSVTLGIVADLYEPGEHQYALAFIVLSSCSGSVYAPIVGGFITQHLPWFWPFWVSLALGAVSLTVWCFVPETRPSLLLDREARSRRAADPTCEVYGPNEIRGSFRQRVSPRELATLMWRPYKFLCTEPIVAFLSLLSGFSDALIFTSLDSMGLVLGRWGFSTWAKGLGFIPLQIGNFLAWFIFLFAYRFVRRAKASNIKNEKLEQRLWVLLWLAPLEVIGLFGFAWTSLGPPLPWISPLLFTVPIGIANYAIYLATIDYMVAAYGPYAASATGGNGFCRDFLAGIAALYATPFYTKIKPGTKWQLPIPTFILSGCAALFVIPVYVFYFKGEYFRNRSPYAVQLQQERENKEEAREEAVANVVSGGEQQGVHV